VAPYETVRKADVRSGVLRSVEIPPSDPVKVTIARFDPELKAVLFNGPILIRYTDTDIE
jgi:hypothetical protein